MLIIFITLLVTTCETMCTYLGNNNDTNILPNRQEIDTQAYFGLWANKNYQEISLKQAYYKFVRIGMSTNDIEHVLHSKSVLPTPILIFKS